MSELTATSARLPPFDSVVLAGGAARRLGGASKPDVELAGRRLLDHVLDATRGAELTVVVGPDSLPVRPGVLRTLEDPPLGGPVAGIAAGLAALDDHARQDAPDIVLVIACDLPYSASAVPRLVRAAAAQLARAGADSDDAGACLVDDTGQRQWLLGAYNRSALRNRLARLETEAGTVRDAGVRQLLGHTRIEEVEADEREAVDIDSWADHARETHTRRI